MSDSLWPHEMQHARLPCPSLSLGTCSDSCPLSRWYRLIISSSAGYCLLLLPSASPRIWIVCNGLALPIRCPKYWSVSFSISPSNKYLGLISFRINWFYLLAVQRTLKSLLQHQFWKRIWKHQFFSAQTSLWSNSHIQTWLLEKP